MDNSIGAKLRNPEEWNDERSKVKPFIDTAVDYHNRARTESRWKNYETALDYYRKAIENYKNAISQHPKYYLHDLLDRIEHVLGEYINNIFNFRISGNRLKDEDGINEFVAFIDGLKEEEKRYLESCDIAYAYLRIGDFYYDQGGRGKAYEFYNKVLDMSCPRPFINRDSHFKMGKVLYQDKRFKEALVSFISVLCFDRDNQAAIKELDACLKRLNISEHRQKFLKATPKEATKLIMEVL